VVKAPRELVGFKYEMIWHARLTADPAHEWFRNQARAVAKELGSHAQVPRRNSIGGKGETRTRRQ
jgi:hypothetical protein